MSFNEFNLSDLITKAEPNSNNTFFQYKAESSHINAIEKELNDFKERSENNMLMILDGSSILTTAYYADPLPRITKDGINTNAILGAMRNISSLIYFQKPTHLVVTLDRTRMTFRTLLYDKYKSNRKPTPEDLKEQFTLFEEVLKNIGIPVLVTDSNAPREETYEADDYSATLVRMFSKQIPVCCISRDSDYLQLVGENSLVYIISQKSKALAKSIGLDLSVINIPPNAFPYSLETLKATKNMTPEKIVQYKAIVGDTSDCIPGIPGVGSKTGPILLDIYDNISSLYEKIESLTNDELKELATKWENDYNMKSAKTIINKLLKGKEMAYISEKLGRMKSDIPLDLTLNDIKLNIDKKKWNNEMTRLEIRSLYLR